MSEATQTLVGKIKRPHSLAAILSNLQRKDEHVSAVLEHSTHVTVYAFDVATRAWERKGMEGSLFIVQRTCAPAFKMMVLNRLGFDHMSQALTSSFKVQRMEDYLMFTCKSACFFGDNPSPAGHLHGIWFHNAEERERVQSLLERVMKLHRSGAERNVDTTTLGHQEQHRGGLERDVSASLEDQQQQPQPSEHFQEVTAGGDDVQRQRQHQQQRQRNHQQEGGEHQQQHQQQQQQHRSQQLEAESRSVLLNGSRSKGAGVSGNSPSRGSGTIRAGGVVGDGVNGASVPAPLVERGKNDAASAATEILVAALSVARQPAPDSTGASVQGTRTESYQRKVSPPRSANYDKAAIGQNGDHAGAMTSSVAPLQSSGQGTNPRPSSLRAPPLSATAVAASLEASMLLTPSQLLSEEASNTSVGQAPIIGGSDVRHGSEAMLPVENYGAGDIGRKYGDTSKRHPTEEPILSHVAASGHNTSKNNARTVGHSKPEQHEGPDCEAYAAPVANATTSHSPGSASDPASDASVPTASYGRVEHSRSPDVRKDSSEKVEGDGGRGGGSGDVGGSTSAGQKEQRTRASLMDKRALQLTLMSLMEDDRFLDVLHARYVAIMKRRATR